MKSNVLKLAALFCMTLALGCVDRAQKNSSTTDVAVTRIACVGDSITYGYGLHNRKENAWPVQLGKCLGKAYDVRNFGVNGATLLSKANFPYIKRPQYKKALGFKPDVLIIMLGTNDSKHPGDGSLRAAKAANNWQYKADYIGDYQAMIAAFRQVSPKVKIYLCLPTPDFPGAWGINDRTIRTEMIPLIRKVAKECHTHIIDLYTPFIGQASLFPDTVHPNDEGARLIAVDVYKALTGRSLKPLSGKR